MPSASLMRLAAVLSVVATRAPSLAVTLEALVPDNRYWLQLCALQACKRF